MMKVTLNSNGMCKWIITHHGSKMLDAIVEGIIEILFFLLIDVVCFFTGEIIISTLSFGHRRWRWNYRKNHNLTKTMILTDISVWVGMAFWVTLVIIISNFIWV